MVSESTSSVVADPKPPAKPALEVEEMQETISFADAEPVLLECVISFRSGGCVAQRSFSPSEIRLSRIAHRGYDLAGCRTDLSVPV